MLLVDRKLKLAVIASYRSVPKAENTSPISLLAQLGRCCCLGIQVKGFRPIFARETIILFWRN